VDNALSLLPNATDSANRLKNKPEILQKEIDKLKNNVKSLQNKVITCRNMVNRYVFNITNLIHIFVIYYHKIIYFQD